MVTLVTRAATHHIELSSNGDRPVNCTLYRAKEGARAFEIIEVNKRFRMEAIEPAELEWAFL